VPVVALLITKGAYGPWAVLLMSEPVSRTSMSFLESKACVM